MKRKSLLFTALLLASGSALAQYQLETVTVRPAGDSNLGVMTFACNNLHEPSPNEVEALLKISDKSLTPKLSNELMDAVGDACGAGIQTIVVERAPSARKLTWFAAPVYVDTAPGYYDPEPVYVEPEPVYYYED